MTTRFHTEPKSIEILPSIMLTECLGIYFLYLSWFIWTIEIQLSSSEDEL